MSAPKSIIRDLSNFCFTDLEYLSAIPGDYKSNVKPRLRDAYTIVAQVP